MSERLDKFISSRSDLSRKDVKALLHSGKIRVNGQIVRDPAFAVQETDELEVNGAVFSAPRHIYLMLNKPQGVVSASASGKEKTVVNLVPPQWQRSGLFPAGRLDKDTTGFVLLTDDGAFAHEILSPRKHVRKVYRVTLRDRAEETYADLLAEGIRLADGTQCRSAEMARTDDPFVVRLTIHEGRYHQVKRMFAALGNAVVQLHREQIGSLSLDAKLAPGECRLLTDTELRLIAEQTE